MVLFLDEDHDEENKSKLSLWGISSAIERESEQIKSQINSFYDYQYTENDINSIGDGGRDMFDTGNLVKFWF